MCVCVYVHVRFQVLGALFFHFEVVYRNKVHY